MSNFYPQEPLEQIDAPIKKIIDLEYERQERKLILIPSESSAPVAIRESLGSVLQNIYAEGYPDEFTRTLSEKEILDVENQLIYFHRYSDPRYYKGVEFADTLEALARRRCAELFANKQVRADNIFVNVQALSGAPANNAVYQALIQPGDVVLGMNLFHGGHLTHGSSVNRSGKLYNVFHYSVDPETERINYEKVAEQATSCQPKIIIAGYSSYPWAPDWKKLKEIAQSVGAYLFADVSHIAGLIAGKAIPSPVGYADVITFTTHKTMCGPRGACILSFDESISRKIDRAVFPGEQGGPHVQVFAAMATSFKLAATSQFAAFQKQILKNCKALSNQLASRGLRIAYGGTDTHLVNIDCKSVIGKDGTPLLGDLAARVLDIAGLVVNANTIPGDKSSARASGIRLGTPWITQRGLVESDVKAMGDIIADILYSMEPYQASGGSKPTSRAKVDFLKLEKAKLSVRDLVNKAISSGSGTSSGYPFFHFLDDFDHLDKEKWVTFEVSGEKLPQIINYSVMIDAEDLLTGKVYQTRLFVYDQFIDIRITKQDENHFLISCPSGLAGMTTAWLRSLSDGYIRFDDDLLKRIPGPFFVRETDKQISGDEIQDNPDNYKPYFVGISEINDIRKNDILPEFRWEEKESKDYKKTTLYAWHVEQNAKIIPFAGWEMPVWYSSVLEEHRATREQAGLFDVTHMGVFEASGFHALSFLDCVCGNDISSLQVGQSCYTHFLFPNADVVDDLLVYRHDSDKYLLVVNAANEQKDWAWLNAVKNKSVAVDEQRAWAHSYGTDVDLRNLKDEKEGDRMRVDIALQGPLSNQVLKALNFSIEDLARILALKRTELCHAEWQGTDLIISRTGYTGEKLSYEIFIHPEKAMDLWNEIIAAGKPFGLKPCGLGARDSLRTEAGLPLYGHEMAGVMNLGVTDAGFGSFVKTYKPWFIGREAFIRSENIRKSEIVRFRFEQQRVRLAHYDDPVFNDKGRRIGSVTSCAIDKEGFINGQAYIEMDHGTEGTELYIYQNAASMDTFSIQEIEHGGRVQLPSKAVVISRFPKL